MATKVDAIDATPNAIVEAAAELPLSPPVVEVVVPVFTEIGTLAQSVRRLYSHLDEMFPLSFRMTSWAASAGRSRRPR